MFDCVHPCPCGFYAIYESPEEILKKNNSMTLIKLFLSAVSKELDPATGTSEINPHRFDMPGC